MAKCSFPELRSSLRVKLGSPIARIAPLGGGCISSAALLETEDGERFFCKWNNSAPSGFFKAETNGLKALASTNTVRVPNVIAFEDSETTGLPYIILELLEPGKPSVKSNEELGRQLAKLHRQSVESYGFEQDNFIGSLVQRNSKTDTWSEFFFTNRICVQAKLGSESGWFDSNFERVLIKKEAIIREILSGDEEVPCLLHGDLWSGNVFWALDGPVLIDPAVYWGSREADLAFTELFGGFDSRFYAAYNEVYPLQSGYKERKEVLNLYHLMTHSNLFGGHYVSSAYSLLTKLG